MQARIKQLGELRRHTVNNAEGCGPNSGYEELTRKIINSYSVQLSELTSSFMAMQKRVDDDEKAMLKRQVEVVTGGASGNALQTCA